MMNANKYKISFTKEAFNKLKSETKNIARETGGIICAVKYDGVSEFAIVDVTTEMTDDNFSYIGYDRVSKGHINHFYELKKNNANLFWAGDWHSHHKLSLKGNASGQDLSQFEENCRNGAKESINIITYDSGMTIYIYIKKTFGIKSLSMDGTWDDWEERTLYDNNQ